MSHGLLALVGRSLRVDARSWQPHLARLGLMGAIYLSLVIQLWNSMWFGAPGFRFLQGIAYLNLGFMTLLGISFFSTSISEEKEEDTLGMMMMAGISPLGILIGKLGGRMVQALLLVAMQYPFTLLAITMGGVTQAQVSAVYIGLTAYLILLGGFGLLCSTIGSNNRSAAMYMILGLAVYVIVPNTAVTWYRWLLPGGTVQSHWSGSWLVTLLDYVSRTSVFNQMGTILTTGFQDPIWTWQVVSNSLFGIACFGMAWTLFGICTRNPTSEATSRRPLFHGRGALHWFSPGRAWSNPLAWKDYYFISGGLGMILIRLAFCLALYGVAMLQFQWSNQTSHDWYMAVSFYQFFLSLAVVIEASRILSRSVHDEIRGRTLSALLMLPGPTLFVIYSKFAGALLGWLPVALIDLFVSVSTEGGRQNLNWALNHQEGICISGFLILIPHLALLFSVYVRWGAVPLAIAVAFGLFVGVVGGASRRGALLFILTGLCIVFVLCHAAVVIRIRSFTARL